MTHICAWCEGFINKTDGPADQVTHGICETCFERVTNNAEPVDWTYIIMWFVYAIAFALTVTVGIMTWPSWWVL